MSVDIKICGLTQPDDMRVCADLGVKWAGFVFYPPSPRYITLEQAAKLDASVPSAEKNGMMRVGLFVNPKPTEILNIFSALSLDVIQLYSTAESAAMLCAMLQRPCWLAKGIKMRADLPAEKNGLAGYVIEAPAEEADTRPGGLGRSFDWSLTQGWQAPAPWLLAGGLTPDNVQQAIRESGARAVDVSSGVEERPGVKSAFLIEEFVKKARE